MGSKSLENLFLSLKIAGFDDEKRVLEEYVFDENFFMFSIFINALYILNKDIDLYLQERNLFLSFKLAAFDDELKRVL